MSERQRRSFKRDFKLAAVKKHVEQGLSAKEVASDLKLDINLIYNWKKAFQADGSLDKHLESSTSVEADLKRLREENRQLRIEREVLKKCHGLLCQGKEVRYRFILEHAALWPIEVQCRVLEVSRAGYYKWRNREPSETARKQAEIVQEIKRIHELPRHDDYGSPRMHRLLLKNGYACCENTVARLMKRERIRARTPRKFKVVTTDSGHDRP